MWFNFIKCLKKTQSNKMHRILVCIASMCNELLSFPSLQTNYNYLWAYQATYYLCAHKVQSLNIVTDSYSLFALDAHDSLISTQDTIWKLFIRKSVVDHLDFVYCFSFESIRVIYQRFKFDPRVLDLTQSVLEDQINTVLIKTGLLWSTRSLLLLKESLN